MKINKLNAKKISIVFLAFLFSLLIISFFIPVSKTIFLKKLGFSFEIYDINGVLLRKGLSSKGFYFANARIDEIPKHVIKTLISAEDKRYYYHNGVDIIALFKSFIKNITGKNKYGGSTITMQIARNLYNLPRNIFSKIYEIWLAVRLENTFTKKEILELYFNTIPFGKQIVGIKMAARIYFDKEINSLSHAQSAFLISLVKYPTLIKPGQKINKKISKRKNYILKILKKHNKINDMQYKLALKEKIRIKNIENKFLAPHFTDFILKYVKKHYKNRINTIEKIYTTLNISTQKDAEQKAANSIKQLKNKKISNASVIVIDNNTNELRAMVGSINYYSNSEEGQVNGSTAIRSPGSTLKPFMYATAMDNNVVTAATVIPDVKTRIKSIRGDFIPFNHNRSFNGPITMRIALACSYNVPAARVISKASVTAVLQKLKQCGFKSLNRNAQYYGASLTLGGADVTLLELTSAFTIFAHKGIYRKIKFIKKIVDINGSDITKKPVKIKKQIFSKETSFIISDILSDNKARETSFTLLSSLNLPFFCAAKTGTSKGYRNNWTVGFSKNYTIGVWVGNFDNTPMQGVNGVTGAGNIFRKLMLSFENDYDYKPKIPKNIVKRVICSKSGKLAKRICDDKITEYFVKGTEPLRECNVHYSIPFYKINNKVAFIKKKMGNYNPQIQWKKVLILPQLYNEWLEQNGYKPVGKNILQYVNWLKNKNVVFKKRVKILYPDNSDVFRIDPIIHRRYQTITFRGQLPLNTKYVIWKINNKKFIIKNQPFSLTWEIKKGHYKVTLISVAFNKEKTASKPVHFLIK